MLCVPVPVKTRRCRLPYRFAAEIVVVVAPVPLAVATVYQVEAPPVATLLSCSTIVVLAVPERLARFKT